MKLTIDTENKTIAFEYNVKLSEAVKELKKLVGEDWKNYEIIPQYLGNYPIVTYPVLPYVNPYDTFITCDSDTTISNSYAFTLTN